MACGIEITAHSRFFADNSTPGFTGLLPALPAISYEVALSSKPSQRARQLADRIRDMLRLSPLQEDAMTAGRHVRKPDHRSPSLSVLSNLLDDSRRIGRPAADRLQTRALEEQHA
ncbi:MULTISPECIES: hypothetical protein [Sphingobium]|uniref:Uncharacterized protein n=1 Tax=Sphingobium fuliginis (strain ATCC 27551) TaxID=336203 RepID=A0ABQ1F169_SPHSA|nr:MULTISPECIES: hypothetical protein [Sphingobium]AJR23814.1 hypothetical protein TZ53_08850 [Sphingobium sp. YBL2]GFZ95836.1 hypothetical protein GCM10019071_27690 [Sphingobium fuliginis]